MAMCGREARSQPSSKSESSALIQEIDHRKANSTEKSFSIARLPGIVIQSAKIVSRVTTALVTTNFAHAKSVS